ncbi:hypothetical protein FPOA_11549 [Fusarium poae]|jgi:hypothetical protein|uniref:Uncharacterized protein n=2 Tax=Fusarium poae TaxID=36050 RepID=A0A1B8AHU7_FUSPO|nr:hypothetical protein FPOA_11549 [Fusarium poae]
MYKKLFNSQSFNNFITTLLSPSATSNRLLKHTITFSSAKISKMGLPTFSESTTTTTSSSQTPQEQQNSSTGVATGAGANTGAGVTRPKTEAELEADRLYEEAMEEEYAKRDGGS